MRANNRDAARRAQSGVARATVRKTDSSKLWPEHHLDLLSSETQDGVEHAENYGFAHVPMPQDQDASQGQQGQAQSSGQFAGEEGQQPTGDAAEAIVAFLGGNRSHGVVVSVGDRRFRLKGLKNGEVALYDDQQQQVHLTRDGIVAVAPNSKKITLKLVEADQQQGQGSQGQSGRKQYGTKPLSGKDASDSIVIEKGKITITTKALVLKADTISNQVTDHFETVGKTRLGLDATGEIGAKVETAGGEAKQTWAKV